jgi:hypothetical protein
MSLVGVDHARTKPSHQRGPNKFFCVSVARHPEAIRQPHRESSDRFCVKRSGNQPEKHTRRFCIPKPIQATNHACSWRLEFGKNGRNMDAATHGPLADGLVQEKIRFVTKLLLLEDWSPKIFRCLSPSSLRFGILWIIL